MSMYSGIIKSQAEAMQGQLGLIEEYHSLARELTDVLAQHVDVGEYERRLAALDEKGGRT